MREAGEGTVIAGRHRATVQLRVAAGAERERPWHAFVEMYPQAEHYAEFTDRELPLVVLERTSS